MGFFNINTILYTFRKVSKYLLLSLIVIAFIIVCLLLMSKNSNAGYYPAGSYNMVRSDSSYHDAFDVTYTISSTGVVSVSGTMGKRSNPVEATLNFTWDFLNYFDANYDFIPVVCHNYANAVYLMYKVPKGSTYYAYNSLQFGSDNYCSSFYCDSPHYVYVNYNTTPYDLAAGHIDTLTDYSTYCLCTNYTDSNLTTVVYPETPVIPDPQFLNYEDSSTYGNTLVNGEFENFVFKVYDDSSVFAILHDITDGQPSDIFTADSVNSSIIDLKDVGTSFTGEFIFKYLTSIDNGVYTYTVPVTSFFGRYKNNRHYMLVLSYPDGYKQYDWTTNFSSDGITIQNENINTQIDNSINNLNNTQKEINDFLNDDTYDSSQIVDNMPNSDEYSAPTDTGINTLFTSLYNAFTRDSAEPVRFYLPFVDGAYIDIPADIVSSHLPSPIIFLIQTFYWYLICRYIIKDIAGIAQKAKSGEILDASTDNIKTELL